MLTGPQQERLARALTGAAEEVVDSGASEWRRCALLVSTVASALGRAALNETALGGQTGPAMATAFRTTAEGMGGKAQQLRRGDQALTAASHAIIEARVGSSEMNHYVPQPPDPGAYTPPPGPPDDGDLKAQAAHRRDVTAFQDAFDAREQIARQWADRLDEAFAESTATMKEIHGEKDPAPDRTPGGGGGGPQQIGTGPGGGRTPWTGTVVHTGTDHDNPTFVDPDHGTDEPGDPTSHDTDVPPSGDPGGSATTPPATAAPGLLEGFVPGTAQESGSGGGLPGGVTSPALGAVAGGGLAGAAIGGLRGGMVAPTGSVPGAPVRPIGSTARAGSPGALGRSGAASAAGRSGAAATGSPTSRPTGRAGASSGRGAAGAGGTAGRPGGRGSAAATGSGAGAGRRGARRADDDRHDERDLFDDGQDWIDDTGAAPGVLD